MLAVRDRCFAPVVLAPFASDLARRLARLTMGPLLEIAADTGVLTQAIASVMSAGMTVVATDSRASWVEYASMRPGTARASWQPADPHALPFADASFGIVASLFAVATMRDRIRAFREVRRVMRPNGRFAFNVPGHIRQNPVAECVQTSLEQQFPADPPVFLPQGLHGYADNETIDDDLTAAGFTDAIYTTVDLPLTADSAADLALGYCLGTDLREDILARTLGRPEPVIDAVVAALRQRFGIGPIQASMRAHVVFASG